ncbi:unnamed protein product [Rotaria socialis]|uniref:Potassium channel domain-containing protein n=1 Tax=Rotaria socialis TaxID=392032 RepID=A0A817X1Z3_9BILA|nr:unnamed protein product [Rotaria socialis]
MVKWKLLAIIFIIFTVCTYLNSILKQHINYLTDDTKSTIIKTLVFIHIQKTAGSEFERSIVRRLHFGSQPSCRCPMRSRFNRTTRFHIKLKCNCSRNNEPWLISRFSVGWLCGVHADWITYHRCLPPKMNFEYGFHQRKFIYATLLREPVTRFISEYLHTLRGANWLSERSSCQKAQQLRNQSACWKNTNLTDFILCPFNSAINRQTRMLSSSINNCLSSSFTYSNLIDLKTAKKNLESMEFFGLTEYLYLSQRLFERVAYCKLIRTCSFQSYLEQNSINNQTYDYIEKDLISNDLNRIKQINSDDIELPAGPDILLTSASTTPFRIQNYRTLAYVVITLVYLVIGAAIFDRLESTQEAIRHANLTARIAAFQQQHNMSDGDFINLTRTVELRLQYRKKQWKFIGSFYYATVVLALIGYGHAIPHTKAGRAVTIAYALIGIPMWLIMIQSVGERLNSLIRFVVKRIKRRIKRKREPQVTAMELLTCEALLILLTLVAGSYVFHRYESWRYFDAFYYCVLTLTTIGFGDLVPMQKEDYGRIGWLYILFCIMFILTGLTVVASSGNLLILRFVETNSKRSQHERYEMEERRRQQVRIVGDVISSNGRLVTLEDDEDTPSLIGPGDAQRITMGHSTSDLSLCSCRAQPSFSSCIPIAWKTKFKRKHQNLLQQKAGLLQPQMIVVQSLREQILDSLRGKTEIDENMALQRSYLQLDKILKRSSI